MLANNKKRQGPSVSTESVLDQEKTEKREILIEEVRDEGSSRHEDIHKETHRVELEFIDISEQVPESVKIIYDMNRLLEIEETFKGDDVSRGWHGTGDNYGKGGRYIPFITRDIVDYDSIDMIVEKYIRFAERERGESLTKDDSTLIDDAELDSIAEQAKKDFAEFRDSVTGGLFNNPNVLYHTIGAYTEGLRGSDLAYDADTMIDKKGTAAKLRNRYPNDSGGAEVKEDPLEVDAGMVSDGLFVHAGKLVYDNMTKPLMLIDASSPRFRKHIESFTDKKDGDHTLNEHTDLQDILDAANTGNQWGALLHSRNEIWTDRKRYQRHRELHWLLVADQIFDPYHGRLIKIKEIDNPQREEATDQTHEEDMQ